MPVAIRRGGFIVAPVRIPCGDDQYCRRTITDKARCLLVQRCPMKRFFIISYFVTVMFVFFLSCVYEFLIEDNVDFFLGAGSFPHEIESIAVHWEYVVTVTIFSAVALLLPFSMLYKMDAKWRKIEAEKLALQIQLDDNLAKMLSGFVNICIGCKKVRIEKGDTANERWDNIADYISQRTDLLFSHGYCPECAAQAKAQMRQFCQKVEKNRDEIDEIPYV